MKWPNNKDFAFTIVDDTDFATVSNIKPIYDFLYKKGFLTTKTVWVYPSRDKFIGDCLQDDNYLHFIKDIQKKGFDIQLHNVGSGIFSREEILAGVEIFKDKIGKYPTMQINHASNPDCIYWGNKRFSILLRSLYKIFF